MKTVKYVLLAVLGVLVLVQGMMIIASESAEVVVLTIPETDGERELRLWVVDHEGSAYLRGDEASGWMPSLQQAAVVQLQRGGERAAYQPRISTEERTVINQLMRGKYGWRDQYISWLTGDRDSAMPIELIPLP